MNRIKNIRKALGYTQAKFASILNVSRTTVTMWETQGTEPDFETLCKISDIFDIPSDYIVGAGVFENWEEIIDNYDDVARKLREYIPPDFAMPTIETDCYLVAWLDQMLYKKEDELLLIRWFNFAIRKVIFETIQVENEGESPLSVEIEFTPAFEGMIDKSKKNARQKDERRGYVVKSVQAIFAETVYDLLTPTNQAKANSYLNYLLAEQAAGEEKP